jgi:hypothetical protein
VSATRRQWGFDPSRLRIPPPVTAPVTESLIDSLVGDVVGYLVALREPHYGGVPITDEQAWERARNVVAGLIGNYRIERLPDEAAPLVTGKVNACFGCGYPFAGPPLTPPVFCPPCARNRGVTTAMSEARDSMMKKYRGRR